MKIIIKYSFGLLVGALVLLSSCRDFVEPNIPYAEFDTGVYLRTIDRTSTTFNFFDLGSSNFALTLEAVDIEDGGTVETVEIRVRHRRLIPGVGLQFTPEEDVLVTTLDASDFAPNSETRFLRTSFSIPAADAIAAVGLTEDEIEGGDVFEFRLVLTDRLGRKFTNTNRTADIAGGLFYSSPFFYQVSVICPVEDDFAVGAYDLTQTAGGADPFFGNGTRFVEEEVVLEAVDGNATRRTFDVDYLGGFITRSFTIEFSCGKLIKPRQNTGVGCSGNIFWESDNNDLPDYDISDDSIIIVRFIDDIDDGCGVRNPVEFTLTKK